MKFGRVPVGEAMGAVLAHSLRVDGHVFKKGRVSAPPTSRRCAAPATRRWSARASSPMTSTRTWRRRRSAARVASENVRVAEPTTGRANLFATARGLVTVDRAAIDRLNAIDESVTLATVAPYARVDEGQMVATVKIIPFAVPGATLARVTAAATPLVSVRRFAPVRAGLVLTRFAETPASLLDRAAANQRERLRLASAGPSAASSASLTTRPRSPARIAELAAEGCAPILVLGASAIVDRRDVVPAALSAPAARSITSACRSTRGTSSSSDGRRRDRLGVPGCARSLKPSGFDWVLERLSRGSLAKNTLADLRISLARRSS